MISDRGSLRVSLAGVPTLPDELLRQYRSLGLHYVEPEPTGELLSECQASIEAACREIRRRCQRRSPAAGPEAKEDAA